MKKKKFLIQFAGLDVVTMTTHIRFYFDYMSPYAYVNWVNLQRLLKEYAGQLVVTYHPISFPTLIRAWGTTPASSIPPKMAFIFKDVYRTSRNRYMTFSVPSKWPFPTGLLLCLSSATVGGLDQQKIINAIWSAIWGSLFS
jgi:2-hydroxychromene-2-carboxylate isomerase